MNDRETTVYDLARIGCTREQVRTILKALPAIQRAHEAACCAWHPETVANFEQRGAQAFSRLCGALYPGVESRYGSRARIVRQHDPRGACVSVYAPNVDAESGEPALRLGAVGFTVAQMRRTDAMEATTK